MAKHLKLNIKNAQIAEAVNLGSLKNKLAKKKEAPAETPVEESPSVAKTAKGSPAAKTEAEEPKKDETPRKARSKSAFAEGTPPPAEVKAKAPEDEPESNAPAVLEDEPSIAEEKIKAKSKKSGDELRKEIFGEDVEIEAAPPIPFLKPEPVIEEKKPVPTPPPAPKIEPAPRKEHKEPQREEIKAHAAPRAITPEPRPHVKLGPTGRHINDLLPKKAPPPPKREEQAPPRQERAAEKKPAETAADDAKNKLKTARPKGRDLGADIESEMLSKKAPVKVKEFRDIKPAKRVEQARFDGRDRQGLRESEDEQRWRKRRQAKTKHVQEDVTIRPTSLKVRIPISIKDLASEMKLKASQLIAKMFLQGVAVTINDLLEDETTIQLLGNEFGCEITIDTSEEERIRVTGKSIREEITAEESGQLKFRPPVVAFMGHVDHGKTSLIDAIRKSNRAAGEAGAITQHIGAFMCSTAVGDIAILDTPGHEAFSSMRARGADVTDIVVLVVAGDEGIRQQTLEAIQHARAANVTIVVAINKSDKPNFNAENVYRQLAELELLPEAWGGQTITVNCSAQTGEGIPQLLEMLALQAEVLELRANPDSRARGRVLESEMHKGMGSVATVLVQNGTLRLGDSLVFDQYFGRVKTMQDEYGRMLEVAGPSTPVEITGLSGLPEAGQEFIVVKNEREAREISEARTQGLRQSNLLLKKKVSMENLFQQASDSSSKKILNVIVKADVQGSLEALKAALMKIESQKAEIHIILTGVGEVTESDVQLAGASKAVIIGFHTQIESHADVLVKQMGIQVRMHDIIYHAIDDVKAVLSGLLDKIAQETEKGKAIVKATFKSSNLGIIAGCQVTEGSIHRNNQIRVNRDGTVIWKGGISSLKRVKEDVREVAKGLECGIVLNGFTDVKEGDVLEAFEVTYITQEL